MARKQKQMSAGWQQRPHQMLLYGDCRAPAEELALGSLHQGAQQGTARSAREHSREHREHKEDREHQRAQGAQESTGNTQGEEACGQGQ